VAELRAAWRHLAAELALALPATATVLLTLFLIEEITHQRMLFTSLAASVFLIYHDPEHRMNTIRSMLLSYLIAAAAGIGLAWIFSPGYTAAAVALSFTISVLILLRSVHPPALATALGLGFSAEPAQSLPLFMLSVLVVVLLVAVQVVLRKILTFVGEHRRVHH
jgi:CBS-domain-containing membrane protein